MIKLKEQMSKLKERAGCYRAILKETKSYLLRPTEIFKLLKDRDYYFNEYEYWKATYTKYIDEYVLEEGIQKIVDDLKDELEKRKAAMDELEQQYDQDMEEITADFQKTIHFLRKENKDLKADLAKSYADNAAMNAKVAAAIAEAAYLRPASEGGDPNALHPKETSADR